MAYRIDASDQLVQEDRTIVTTSSLTEARQNFSEIVDAVVSTGEEWTVTRHGRPVAVVLAADEYDALIETLNILSDPDTMDAIAEATAELDGGD